MKKLSVIVAFAMILSSAFSMVANAKSVLLHFDTVVEIEESEFLKRGLLQTSIAPVKAGIENKAVIFNAAGEAEKSAVIKYDTLKDLFRENASY